MIEGGCLCGAVRFRIRGALSKGGACHCTQCRRQSGHVWAAASAASRDVEITGDALGWFSASDAARRGFCRTCGSFLFWQASGDETIDVALGAIDGPTGLRLERHIFVADKGDYYEIADGLPQHPQGSGGA